MQLNSVPAARLRPKRKAYAYYAPQPLPESVVNEMLSNRKPKKVLNMQSRDIILHVLDVCQRESMAGQLSEPMSAVHSRIGVYVDRKTNMIGKMKSRVQRYEASGRKKGLPLKRIRTYKSVIDDRDLMIIKNLIRDYYIEHGKVPAVQGLVPTVVDQIPTFAHGSAFLEQLLVNMGYKRIKYYSKQSVLVEDPSVTAHRDQYLNSIKKLRNNIENLFYVYECVIDRSFTLHKSWLLKYGHNNALRDKNTFTFICAGSINGFLNHTVLLNKTELDTDFNNRYPGQLRAHTFENWLKDYLIPQLPKNSTIIMDNGPHHCVEAEKFVSFHSSKEEMCEYLKTKNIQCDQTMRRSELYKLIERYRPKHKLYVVDKILGEHQHKTLRLPPHMIVLNPVQYAMDKIQRKFFEDEPVCMFNLENLKILLEGSIASVTKEDWKEFFEKVRYLEDEYWKKDEEFEIAIDKVLLNLRYCVDSGSDTSDSSSDMED